MNSSTVNISFKKDLLKKIDRIAKEESRSRSELIREAARMYIERKAKWNDIFDYGKKQRSRKDIQEQDVVDEIKKYRKANK
jgi:CopG family transcriptional regulator / antitoxin EndoAI